ncbi:MAG: monovalent cation/H+ antiporter complex subunit F [Acidimicrobiia bacterium]|nr:monovalent cation/H+ antiporter complex subunit F [Acidimicrobiia bacterium]
MIVGLALGAFILTATCAGVRLLRGPTLADRVVALDVVLMSLMGAIAVDAADSADTTNLDLLIVIAIVGFTATVAASRFIEREGDRA